MAVKSHQIPLPIYRQIVKIYTGESYKDITTKIEKDYGLEPFEYDFQTASSLVVTHKEDNLIHFILILPKDVSYSTLAHECLHCAWDILGHVDVEVTKDNHEALAYLVGHIMDHAIEIIDKYNGNTKTKSN